jgi:hypothetical protein
MKKFVFGLGILFRRKDSIIVVAISSIIFFVLVLAIQNGKASMEAFSFFVLPFTKRLSLMFATLFDIKNTFSTSTLLLAILGSIIGGINISLAYTYMKMRGEVILKSGLFSGIGLFLAFLGIGCAACGTVFISVLLGFFGLSSVLHMLPYHGQEIGYLGLLVLVVSTYILSHKVAQPNVC